MHLFLSCGIKIYQKLNLKYNKKRGEIEKVNHIDFENKKIIVNFIAKNPCDNGYNMYDFDEVILVFIVDKTDKKK